MGKTSRVAITLIMIALMVLVVGAAAVGGQIVEVDQDENVLTRMDVPGVVITGTNTVAIEAPAIVIEDPVLVEAELSGDHITVEETTVLASQEEFVLNQEPVAGETIHIAPFEGPSSEVLSVISQGTVPIDITHVNADVVYIELDGVTTTTLTANISGSVQNVTVDLSSIGLGIQSLKEISSGVFQVTITPVSDEDSSISMPNELPVTALGSDGSIDAEIIFLIPYPDTGDLPPPPPGVQVIKILPQALTESVVPGETIDIPFKLANAGLIAAKGFWLIPKPDDTEDWAVEVLSDPSLTDKTNWYEVSGPYENSEFIDLTMRVVAPSNAVLGTTNYITITAYEENGQSDWKDTVVYTLNVAEPEPCIEVSDGETLYKDTTLNGSCTYDLPNGLIIGADDVTLDCGGATLVGVTSGSGGGWPMVGVNISSKQNVSVQNCKITNYDGGILAIDSSQITAKGNQIYENVYGIAATESTDVSVTQNTFTNNQLFAIELKGSDGIISSNQLNYPGNQLSVYDSHDLIIQDNEEISRIDLFYSEDIVVLNNTIRSAYDGVALYSSTRVTMRENIVDVDRNPIQVETTYTSRFRNHDHSIDSSNTRYGRPIYYFGSLKNSHIENIDDAGFFFVGACEQCTIRNITMDGGRFELRYIDNSFILENTINNSSSIQLYQVTVTQFAQNSIHDLASINLQRVSHSTFEYNNITNNNPSAEIYTFEDNSIRHNTISGNSIRGIRYYSILRNQIFTNTFEDNWRSFISGTNADANHIYQNNFLNTLGLIYSPNENTWDNGTAGNHWSDYEGWDEDCDKVGDTPHFISPNGEDNFPLLHYIAWGGLGRAGPGCGGGGGGGSGPSTYQLTFTQYDPTLILSPGLERELLVVVKNTGYKDLNSIDFELIGIDPDWYRLFSRETSGVMEPGNQLTFGADFNIPAGAEVKTYKGTWRVTDFDKNALAEKSFDLTVTPFGVQIITPTEYTQHSQTVRFEAQTNLKASCTYTLSQCSKPPEYLEGYPTDEGSVFPTACSAGGGFELPLMDTINGIHHTYKGHIFGENAIHGFGISCTDAEGRKAHDFFNFELNLNDSNLPIIHSFTPQHGDVILGNKHQLFSIEYSEDNVAQINLYIHEQGSSDWDAYSNFVCPSGENQTCNIPVDLSKYDRGTKLNYYFVITDINGNTASTSQFQSRHIPLDAFGSLAVDYTGYLSGFDRFVSEPTVFGDTTVDYLYDWRDKGPIFIGGSEFYWNEQITVNSSNIQARRDDLSSAYGDQYDSVYLTVQPYSLVYELSVDPPIGRSALEGKHIWFLGSEWIVLSSDDGLVKLAPVDSRTTLTTSNPTYQHGDVYVQLNDLLALPGREFQANITVVNGGTEESKYISPRSPEVVAGIEVHVLQAVTKISTSESEVELVLSVDMLRLEDGGFLLNEDGTESPWQVKFDYNAPAGGLLDNIALIYTEAHTSIGRAIEAGDTITLPRTPFEFQYTGLTGQHGASVPTTPVQIDTTIIDDDGTDRPAILITTSNLNAIEYFDKNGIRRKNDEIIIFPADLGNPFYYENAGRYIGTLGGAPRVKVGRDTYSELEYVRVSSTTGFVALLEPSLAPSLFGRSGTTGIEKFAITDHRVTGDGIATIVIKNVDRQSRIVELTRVTVDGQECTDDAGLLFAGSTQTITCADVTSGIDGTPYSNIEVSIAYLLNEVSYTETGVISGRYEGTSSGAEVRLPNAYEFDLSYFIVFEYNGGVFADIHEVDSQEDDNYAYVIGTGGGCGPECIYGSIATESESRDYITRYGTYVSSVSNNGASLQIPASQLFAEYHVRTAVNSPLVTVAKMQTPHTNARIVRRENRIHFVDELNATRIILPAGTDSSILTTRDLTYDFDQSDDKKGFVILHGANLPVGRTKTLIINQRDSTSGSVCIRDSEITSVTEFPETCTNDESINQTPVTCDGIVKETSFGNYTCILNNSQYTVTGLRHSGVMEYVPPVTPSPVLPASSSGGGGGSRAPSPAVEDEVVEDAIVLEQPESVVALETPALVGADFTLSEATAPTGFFIFNRLKSRSAVLILLAASLFSVALYTRRHPTLLRTPTLSTFRNAHVGATLQEPPVLHVTATMKSRVQSLHDREKEIIQFLIDNRGESTQAQIRHATHIPNTSLGRWIQDLQAKGFITAARDRKVKDISLTSAFLMDQELSSTLLSDVGGA